MMLHALHVLDAPGLVIWLRGDSLLITVIEEKIEGKTKRKIKTEDATQKNL